MGRHTPNGGSLKAYRTLLLKLVENIEDDIRLVKQDLITVKGEISAVRVTDIPNINVEIAQIKTEQRIKASVYGLFGGFIPATGVLIYWYLNSQ